MKLQDKMKLREKEAEYIIQAYRPMIVRIDGHKFSKFTKGFNKPFDRIFSNTMEKVTKDLVQKFNAYTGYTQSDEITLYFPSLLEKQPKFTHIFGGRTQKIASLIAAYSTLRFNYYFNEDFDVGISSSHFDKRYAAFFDARVFGVPDKAGVINAFLNRMQDCQRNAKQNFAYTYCGHKKLLGKTSNEQIKIAMEKTGLSYEDVEDRYKYGIFVKRKLYTKIIDDKEVQRRKIISFSAKDWKDTDLSFILEKDLKDS